MRPISKHQMEVDCYEILSEPVKHSWSVYGVKSALLGYEVIFLPLFSTSRWDKHRCSLYIM